MSTTEESFSEASLHPEAKKFLEIMETSSTTSSQTDEEETEPLSVDYFRKVLDASDSISHSGKETEFDGTKTEVFVPFEEVPGGIPIYVYSPKSILPNATILIYFHGGGNIYGSRANVDDTCKILSRLADCIVVNVEYRLAPEHKFPAMINDGRAVLKWTLDNKKLIGGSDVSKVGLAGDSAGGQITASISHNNQGVDFQILIYPFLSGCLRLPSYKKFEYLGQFGKYSLEDLSNMLESAVVEKKEDLKDPQYSILLNDKYDHLPPTLLIVAEFDFLRDDSYEYAKKLTAAGVENELYLVKGSLHGFFTSPGFFVELSGEAYAKVAGFVKRLKGK